MAELFTLDNLVTLGLLTMLQAVLGFDNLLYISLESKRAPEEKQSYVRKMGIGIAVVLRIVLLVLIVKMIGSFQNSLFSFHTSFIEGDFNLHAIIVLFGGAFIMYTAIKEIWHMMSLDEGHGEERKASSATTVIATIIMMNLVFSFDSILSAIALAGTDANGQITTDKIIIMATAIIIGGILMIWLADKVTNFLKRNRLYEVLGLFILFVVGIMLLTEGGHLAHLAIGGNHIEAMSKTTFYFVIFVLVLTDVVQSRYQKKLLMEKDRMQEKNKA